MLGLLNFSSLGAAAFLSNNCSSISRFDFSLLFFLFLLHLSNIRSHSSHQIVHSVLFFCRYPHESRMAHFFLHPIGEFFLLFVYNLLFLILAKDRVDLVENDYLGFVGKTSAPVPLQFVVDHGKIAHRIVPRGIHQVENHATSLDVSQKGMTEADSLARSSDETGNITKDQSARTRRSIRSITLLRAVFVEVGIVIAILFVLGWNPCPEIRYHGSEWVIGNPRFRTGHRGKEC
mmetsp:Transcript_17121/g.39357  ORF Transcript_17121/g.39357 Transcript_17121/m.39357 type:complete len:233 (-) Transcript_17121:984-1682(-)